MTRRPASTAKVSRRKNTATSRVDRLEARLLRLSLAERAHLAERLLLSLDAPLEEENLRMWVEEAERRLRELRNGKGKEVPAAIALRRARAAISCGR